jgi:hypothetical protein
MLRLEAWAATVEPDRRGTPDASPGERKWLCYAGMTDPQDRFWQNGDLLMPFRDSLQTFLLSKTCRLAIDLGNIG